MLINAVAPFAGAWIEIANSTRPVIANAVAPFAGAWIEIFKSNLLSCDRNVAPFAGAWIEIAGMLPDLPAAASLPSRERGLKF